MAVGIQGSSQTRFLPGGTEVKMKTEEVIATFIGDSNQSPVYGGMISIRHVMNIPGLQIWGCDIPAFGNVSNLGVPSYYFLPTRSFGTDPIARLEPQDDFGLFCDVEVRDHSFFYHDRISVIGKPHSIEWVYVTTVARLSQAIGVRHLMFDRQIATGRYYR
jgi:hypothetical protein